MELKFHSPEGVRDIYGLECEKKHIIDRAIKDAVLSYGYEQLETPTFEYFDTFSKVGTVPAKDMYKFFDREGNTLVLRPDVTPSVARTFANYFKDTSLLPVRLFYSENVFVNYSSHRGRLKETTQIGAELIGDNSIFADAEITAMAVKALEAAGLSDFTVSIGHVNLLKGLFSAYNFTEEEEALVYDRMINRNVFGLEELLLKKGVDKKLLELFTSVGRLFSSVDEFEGIKESVKEYPLIADTFTYFIRLYELLSSYGVCDHISFELGLVSRFKYYSGILFYGYTYGSGQAILSGGRYDRLMDYFGCDMPATGFAVMSDELLAAMERQGIDIPVNKRLRAYFYDEDSAPTVIRQALADREAGFMVSTYKRPLSDEEMKKASERLSGMGYEVIYG